MKMLKMLKTLLIALCLILSTACGDNAAETGGVAGPTGGVSGEPGGVSGEAGDYASTNASPNGSAGEFGATPGGAQDIEYFRQLVESGTIPPADSLTVEGLLSEHDLGVTGPACDELLCLRPALGVAPSLATGELEYWVQIGMTSGIREFERPPLDLVILIDKSGSMSIDMVETIQSSVNMLHNLRPEDGVSVVIYDSEATTLQAPARVADIDLENLEAELRGIAAAGGANMQEGLQLAYDNARAFESGDARMTRVVLLSCGYPDSSYTSEGSFRDIVGDGAADGIGLTFIGILLSFDYGLAEALTLEAGGNYFYFNDLPRMEKLFEEEFDFIVTPLAYDLKVNLTIDDRYYAIDRLYGIPGDDGAPRAGFEVSTAFISKRKGAMFARLKALTDSPPKQVAEVELSYRPEPAHGWTNSSTQSNDLISETTTAAFDSPGVRKGVALVNMAESIKTALLEDGRGEHDEAMTRLEELRNHLAFEAEELDDDALRAEVELVDALIALMVG